MPARTVARPRALAIATLVALALLLAACGSETGGSADATASTTALDGPTTTVADDAVDPSPSPTDPSETAAALTFRAVLGVGPLDWGCGPPPGEPASTSTSSVPLPSASGPIEDRGTVPVPEPPVGSDLLPSKDGTQCYAVGPVGFTGADFATAEAKLNGDEWLVDVTVRDESVDRANRLFNACATGDRTCPGTTSDPGSVAIVLDGTVQSAPAVQALNLASDNFTITGNFTQAQAEDLAHRLD